MYEQEKTSTSVIVLRVLFTIGMAAALIFIFYNSSQVGAISSGRSAQVTAKINSFLLRMGSGRTLSELAVRKLGHFAEFALLGFLMMLTLRVYTRRMLAFITWPLFFGLFTAVMDEFFQLYVPGRSSQVSDVLIDFVGVLGGMFFGLLIVLILGLFFSAFRKE